MVHRDISYTNILIRSPTENSTLKRRELMDELGLSQIELLRRKLKSREGLLIDFDYASSLESNTDQAGASNDNQCQDKSQSRVQDIGEGSVQSSGQDSSQCESRDDFEMVDEENSKTIIQPIAKNISVARTVS